MKDYSKNHYEQQTYILSYKIKDQKIIAVLATGESYTIPYTKENEEKIISKMESQARIAEAKPIRHIEKISAVLHLLAFPLATSALINHCNVEYGFVFGVIAAGAIAYTGKWIIHSFEEYDIKKLNYFLDNQQELNDNIKKSENILLNIRKKTVNQIKKHQNSENKTFTINNIDNYSLEELRQIKANIKRTASFDFYENNTFENSKEKSKSTLTRTLKPKNK